MVVYLWSTNQPYWLDIQQQRVGKYILFVLNLGQKVCLSRLKCDFEGCGDWDLEGSFAKLYSFSKPYFCLSLLGGLSLKLLTGGLICRFFVLNQPLLIDAFYIF